MDNGASSYRRFLDGDDKGLGEIVRDYKDGLMLYLNSFVNNICVAEELMEEIDLEKAYLAVERKMAVHRAMKKLHPEYRQVLWLIYFDGFSSAEAGLVMKKSSRQMKNLVYRAKSALKSELDKEGFVYEEL